MTTIVTTRMSAARRLLSISAATATMATLGLVAFSAPAHAAPTSSRVWVCKYVGTPGVDERLQTGNNPIRVSGNAADEDNDGQVFVGDQFVDAQGRSVIVQIEGEDPGIEACSPTPPPTDGPTDGPTDKPTDKPTPGNGAPDTGGKGGEVPVGLVGGGALLAAAALVAAKAERRHRAATHR